MAKGKHTIKDIAKKLGVSPATVSRALNDDPRISQKTIDAIKATATQMRYRQNRMAAGLRNGQSKMIGVIIPTANRNFFGNVLRGIEQVANQKGYAVLITQSNDDESLERKNINLLLQANVDGIIMSVARTTRNSDHFKRIQEADVPLVLFDRIREDIPSNAVVIDDYQISYQATKHLIDQGYKWIAHFTGPSYINIYRQRLRGYRDALADHGLSADDRLLKRSRFLGRDEGRQLMRSLLEGEVPVDAVFSASDFSAVGAMQICKEKQVAIPEEIGFVGFANEPFTNLIEPCLSSIDQKPERMGRMAAQIFFEEIEAPEDFIIRKTELNSELIIRASSLKTKKT